MRTPLSILSVLLLALVASPAAAEPPENFRTCPSAEAAALDFGAPDVEAFLASLAGPPPAVPGTSEGEGLALPEVGTPAWEERACSVSRDCGDGNVAACTGNSSCTYIISGVQCDGNEYQCPNFCSISQHCDCCNGPYTGTCWSLRGDCQYTSGGMACDGREFSCERTCPRCPEW